MELIQCWRCKKIYDPQIKEWQELKPGDSLSNLSSSAILKAIGLDIAKVVVKDNDSCPTCCHETGGITKKDVERLNLI